MKMVFDKAGKTYVFEKAINQKPYGDCGGCVYQGECTDIKLFDVEVWLYCISLMPTIYICTEVINGPY